MANLCEGNRVWTAVAGPAASADINNMQDQLALALDEQWINIPLIPTWTTSTAVIPQWDGSDGHLDGGDQADAQARFIVPGIKEGTRIIGTRCRLAGAAGKVAGGITLIKYDGDGTIGSYSMKGATAWPTGGIGFANSVEIAGANPNHVMADDEYLVVQVHFGADHNTHEGEVWELGIKVRLPMA